MNCLKNDFAIMIFSISLAIVVEQSWLSSSIFIDPFVSLVGGFLYDCNKLIFAQEMEDL